MKAKGTWGARPGIRFSRPTKPLTSIRSETLDRMRIIVDLPVRGERAVGVRRPFAVSTDPPCTRDDAEVTLGSALADSAGLGAPRRSAARSPRACTTASMLSSSDCKWHQRESKAIMEPIEPIAKTVNLLEAYLTPKPPYQESTRRRGQPPQPESEPRGDSPRTL